MSAHPDTSPRTILLEWHAPRNAPEPTDDERQAWKRGVGHASGLSMPMPKAVVAQMTVMDPVRHLV